MDLFVWPIWCFLSFWYLCISFVKFGKCLNNISLNTLSGPLSFSSSGTPMIWDSLFVYLFSVYILSVLQMRSTVLICFKFIDYIHHHIHSRVLTVRFFFFPFCYCIYQLYNFFGLFLELLICWDFLSVVFLSSELVIVCCIIWWLFKHPCMVIPTSGLSWCWYFFLFKL